MALFDINIDLREIENFNNLRIRILRNFRKIIRIILKGNLRNE